MNQEKSIQNIGDKVTARYKTFFDDKFQRLHSSWIPYIQVDGEMLPIHDPSTVSGQAEAASRYKALKFAKKTKAELNARLAATK